MANTYKTLGQSKPTAATSTTLYTVPASTATIVNTIVACNQSAVGTSIRIGVDVGGTGDATTDYLCFDLPIGGNESLVLHLGVTMAATDLLRVYNTLATVSFNAFGVEIT